VHGRVGIGRCAAVLTPMPPPAGGCARSSSHPCGGRRSWLPGRPGRVRRAAPNRSRSSRRKWWWRGRDGARRAPDLAWRRGRSGSDRPGASSASPSETTGQDRTLGTRGVNDRLSRDLSAGHAFSTFTFVQRSLWLRVTQGNRQGVSRCKITTRRLHNARIARGLWSARSVGTISPLRSRSVSGCRCVIATRPSDCARTTPPGPSGGPSLHRAPPSGGWPG
jgi:hypothetical protein